MTVLAHPDPGRVGDRAVLGELAAGQPAEITRLRPDFVAPRAYVGRPLGDRRLSRRPIVIEPVGELLRLSAGATPTPLRLDGEAVAGTASVQPEQLERGVVLELADRIVLLLHRYLAVSAPEVSIDGLVGDSDVMAELRHEIGAVADLRTSVLLRGESGTGKELVARALHALSPRADGPFVAVNLGALPPALAVGELFGAARGAYTSADAAREGCLVRADGGTVFLDEVGEAPLEVQVALLRVLESGEVQPLGAARPRRVDVRAVAATDADLERRIADGSFKEPLFHRLAGYEISLPPLRRRRDDIGRLLLHFLAEQAALLGGKPIGGSGEPWVDAGLMSRLARFHWPGNVRQLRNVARQLAIGNRGKPCLGAVPAVERLLGAQGLAARAQRRVTSSSPRTPASARRPSEIDGAEILATLRRHRFEVKAAAEALGISRAALYLWIEQHPDLRTAGRLDDEAVRRAHRELGGDLDALVDRLQISRFALRRRLRELGL